MAKYLSFSNLGLKDEDMNRFESGVIIELYAKFGVGDGPVNIEGVYICCPIEDCGGLKSLESSIDKWFMVSLLKSMSYMEWSARAEDNEC